MTTLYCKTTTEDQTQITKLTWTVPDFMDLINKGTTKELRSDESEDTSSEEIDSMYQLKMQFKGTHNDVIEIYFLSLKPVFLEYNLNFTRYNSRGYYYEGDVVKHKDYHIIDAQKWQYVHMMLKINYNSFLAEKSMKLNFEFKEIYNIKVDYDVPEVQLSNDYENLLNSSIFSDITMKSSEAKEYKVHKVVLASRSKVLRAHFEHNTTECISNVVESPLESAVLQEVINFIYTDKATRVDEIPEKLLAAADYYQLSRLKSLCEMALYKKLTVENAIEILQLADMHSANDLKQWTLEFIKDDKTKLITNTDAWAKMESVQLIKTICEYIMDNAEKCKSKPHFNKKITVKNI